MNTGSMNGAQLTTRALLARAGAPGDVLRMTSCAGVRTPEVSASRRLVAVELLNLLRIRRTMGKLDAQMSRGAAGWEMVLVGPGQRMPRGVLLAYARAAFARGVRNVCLARRALVKTESGRV